MPTVAQVSDIRELSLYKIFLVFLVIVILLLTRKKQSQEQGWSLTKISKVMQDCGPLLVLLYNLVCYYPMSNCSLAHPVAHSQG